ncbi:tetratricopeptide repeat family protein [Asticcacaulis biprosthecium C19]|uniref:Tetratricopeptide repeat family protein n=1 Tax=Asticcacaulis biprosthecium C19 TaxID=715226 RepID=F4QGF2_9CAUL|nr:CHAT domain-containing tetratricopeptide repeat protein [Asticcacaulis biprosthecium]EGF93633.1 tetratricopeptide repeat family protein [Asticcacaulis biprosthecium C19]
MTRFLTTISLAALLLLGSTPATAAPAAPQAASTKPDRDSRIADLVARYQAGSDRPTLPELEAMLAELARYGEFDSGLSQVYAYSLARAGQAGKAIAVMDELIAVLAEKGFAETRDMGDTLLARAVFQDVKGDAAGALETRYKAQALFIRVDGPQSGRAATIKAQIAGSLFGRGQLRDALIAYNEALPVMEQDPELLRVYAVQMSNYANALRLAGDLDGALTASRKAVALRDQLPAGHPAVLYAIHNLGTTLMDLGRYGEAEIVLRDGVDLARKLGGKQNVDTVGLSYRLAQVLARQGRTVEAEALLDNALAALDGVNTGVNPDLPGLIHLELAEVALAGGNRTEATAQLDAGLKVLEGVGANGDTTRARLRTRLAETRLLDGDYAAARDQVEQALTYYERDMPPAAPDRIRAAMLHALILARQGETTRALSEAETVSAVMVASLDQGAVHGRQSGLLQAYQVAFIRYADIAVTAGRSDLAFAAAQRAAHSEIAATSQALAVRATAADPRAADLARRLQDAQMTRLRLDRERTFARSRAGTQAGQIEQIDRDIVAVDVELANLAGALDAIFPDFDRLSNPEPLGLKAVQAGLARGHAVVMPLLGDDKVLTFVVTRRGLTWDTAPLDRVSAHQAIDAIRKDIDLGMLPAVGTGREAEFDRQPAWRLGGAIFTPKIQAVLKGTRELDILGSGALMSLPLGLLLTEAPQGTDSDPAALRDSAWLIRSFAVSVKPGLVTGKTAKTKASGFLGVGAPVLAAEDGETFRGGNSMADAEALRRLPGLPMAEAELERMRQALGLDRSDLLTGRNATETRLKQADLSGYSVIAFATHGLVSGNLETLREPALVLTPPDQPSADDDGLLTASDVAGLRLRARWVILSACNSGTGRDAGGSYSGLAKAFMQAGADNLLVSMWPVRDDVADRLSVETVRGHARGDSQAEALRQAVLALIVDESVPGSANPAIWAPFSLVAR